MAARIRYLHVRTALMSHTRPRQHSGQTWDTREGINSGRPIANLPRKIPSDKKIWIVHRNLWKETKMGKEKFKNFQTRSLFKYGHSFSWALQDTKPRLRWGGELRWKNKWETAKRLRMNKLLRLSGLRQWEVCMFNSTSSDQELIWTSSRRWRIEDQVSTQEAEEFNISTLY